MSQLSIERYLVLIRRRFTLDYAFMFVRVFYFSLHDTGMLTSAVLVRVF